MSIPTFTKSVKHAIIMQEKSDLMEKWPLDTKEEHKRTTDKSREFKHSLKIIFLQASGKSLFTNCFAGQI